MSGAHTFRDSLVFCISDAGYAVRRYVEGCKEPNKLLDLLSAVGSDEIEPTKAVAARQALYPEVGYAAIRL